VDFRGFRLPGHIGPITEKVESTTRGQRRRFAEYDHSEIRGASIEPLWYSSSTAFTIARS